MIFLAIRSELILFCKRFWDLIEVGFILRASLFVRWRGFSDLVYWLTYVHDDDDS